MSGPFIVARAHIRQARLSHGAPLGRHTRSAAAADGRSASPPPACGPGRTRAVEPRRTSSVELLWDLVFVFAVTQVTTLMANDLTWTGFAQGLLVLALVWWAWS